LDKIAPKTIGFSSVLTAQIPYAESRDKNAQRMLEDNRLLMEKRSTPRQEASSVLSLIFPHKNGPIAVEFSALQ
jgi:hypothetical protein